MAHKLQMHPSGKVRSNRSKAIPTYASKDPKGDLRQASDPTTPPDVLSVLAAVPNVRWQVAVNPNTPEPVLHKLWSWYHPLAALENPILAYRTLSTGKCFHEMVPAGVKLSVYDALRQEGRQAEVESLLPEFERCQWFGYSWNYSGPKDVPQNVLASAQRHLATDPSLEVRGQMLVRLPGDCLEIFAGDPDKNIRIALARRLPTFVYDWEIEDSSRWSGVVEKLSADPDEDVRQIVAGSKALTPDAHERLAQDPCILVQEALAASGQGKALLEQGWRVLMEGGDRLCLLIAKNSKCHESVRLDLTAHTDLAIRVEAWSHLHFEKVLLIDKLLQRLEAMLSDPQQANERAAVAANRTITTPIIQRLLGCEDQVTRMLAANKRLTDDDRGVLLRHADVETAVNAMKEAQSPALVDLGSRHPFAAVRVVVAGMVGSRAAELRPQLATDASLEVREEVCACLMKRLRTYDGRIMRETLAILSRDPRAKLRAKVVEDYRLPADELPRLCQDSSVRVRLAVLRYQGHKVEGHLGLLDHKRAGVRLEAAKILFLSWRCSASQALREKAITDPCAKVRQVVAQSIQTSFRLLQKLIKDDAPEVQRALVGRYTPRTMHCLHQWMGHKSVKEQSSPFPLLMGNRNPYYRAAAAGVYRVGKKRLRKLAADRCWFVRAMTAKSGHDLESQLMAKLMEDPHPVVREQARERVRKNPSTYAAMSKGGRP
jgi:hypothetical protein